MLNTNKIISFSTPIMTLVTAIGVGIAILSYMSQFTAFSHSFIFSILLSYILLIFLFIIWLGGGKYEEQARILDRS